MKSLCILLGFLLALPAALAQDPAPRAPRIYKAVRSPEVSTDGRVTFRFFAPNAKKVTITYDGGAPLAMSMDARGIWSGTTAPLEPDYYVYSFVMDGVQLADPANPQLKGIVTGGAENLVHVPGPSRLSWEENDVPHGTVHRHRYYSLAIGEQRNFVVYTPPAYDPAGRTQYPVLYLLHGVMEGEDAWTAAGRANVILDNLIAQRKAVPMIVVMPLGYGMGNVPDRVGDILTGRADLRKDMDRFGTSLLNEIAPRVEQSYRVSSKREARGIAGLSMGGAQALYLGLNNEDRFGWVASFSGAFVMYGSKPDPWFSKLPKQSSPRVWIACGKEDFLFTSNRKLKDWLKAQGVKFEETETPGAHTWRVWRRNLEQYASVLFRPSTNSFSNIRALER